MGLIIHPVYTVYSQISKINENITKKMFSGVCIEVVVFNVCFRAVCGRGATGGAGIVVTTIYRHNKIKQNNKRSEFYFLYFFGVCIYIAPRRS